MKSPKPKLEDMLNSCCESNYRTDTHVWYRLWYRPTPITCRTPEVLFEFPVPLDNARSIAASLGAPPNSVPRKITAVLMMYFINLQIEATFK